MEIWPAIDLRNGRCVRLRQGDYDQETVFGDDPAAMARRWVDAGARRLHLVDLDAARGEPTEANRDAVCAIIEAVNVPCQLGGGVRDDGAIRTWLNLGLRRLIVGSAALKNPDWFAKSADAYPDRLAAGIDARNGMVATDGWLETSSTAAVDLAKDLRKRSSHISAIIYTDIARDGMMSGPNVDALKEMESATDIPVIASGGVTTMEDVQMLADSGTFAAIIGRAIYEGTIDLERAVSLAEGI